MENIVREKCDCGSPIYKLVYQRWLNNRNTHCATNLYYCPKCDNIFRNPTA